MLAKDSRVNVLKNMINNYKFVKLKGLENFFSVKIYVKRLWEIKYLKGIAWTFSTLLFMNWINPSLIYLSSLIWIIYMENQVSTANISAFIKLLDQLGGGLRNLPYCIQFFSDLAVSVKRINQFLLAEDIADDYIMRLENAQTLDKIRVIEDNYDLENGTPAQREYARRPNLEDDLDYPTKGKAGQSSKKFMDPRNYEHNTTGFVHSDKEMANLGRYGDGGRHYQEDKGKEMREEKRYAVVMKNGNFFWRRKMDIAAETGVNASINGSKSLSQAASKKKKSEIKDSFNEMKARAKKVDENQKLRAIMEVNEEWMAPRKGSNRKGSGTGLAGKNRLLMSDDEAETRHKDSSKRSIFEEKSSQDITRQGSGDSIKRDGPFFNNPGLGGTNAFFKSGLKLKDKEELANVKEGGTGFKKAVALKSSKVVGFDQGVSKDAPTKDNKRVSVPLDKMNMSKKEIMAMRKPSRTLTSGATKTRHTTNMNDIQYLNEPLLADGEEQANDGEYLMNEVDSEDTLSLGDEAENQVAFELNNLNFQIAQNQLVFIIGKIGSGKSSLLYSLMGEMSNFNQPANVTITKNKINPKLAQSFAGAQSLMTHASTKLYIPEKVSYLSQRPLLFAKTIRENVVLDRKMENQFDEQRKLEEACRNAGMADDIDMMPQGYDTEIGENGSALSGGQRIRLALARCLYQEANLYLFDDPLSALDYSVGEFLMQNTISGLLKNTTRIIGKNFYC
jgi:ABC-type multidrug transport system fused ATPase/permease subunit